MITLYLIISLLIDTLIIWSAGSLLISVFGLAFHLTFLKSLAIAIVIMALKAIFGGGKNNG